MSIREIIYLKCGERYEDLDDHCSYIQFISSVGRALHRCCRSHGFESCSGLSVLFPGLISQLLKLCYNCDDHICLHVFLCSSNICYFLYSFADLVVEYQFKIKTTYIRFNATAFIKFFMI